MLARGGELTASIRTEPRNFTRLGPREPTTDLVALLLHGGLIRINRVTDDVEPWLAESWTVSADGRQYTLKLRPNVTFSDGHPLSADDVVFSFAASYDAGVPESLEVDGKRLVVSALDPLTVRVTFPSVFAPGLRILDNVVILPRHKLEPALEAGTLKSAWGVSTPPSDLVGLGPFVLSTYQSGQRLVFTRNARYWRRDSAETTLPYLDRITLDVVPDESTELLRLESGQSDMTSSQLAAEAYAPLKRAADGGRARLYDLGPALYPDCLWFNLRPGVFAGDPRAAWLQREELRRAISLAVDRQVFADTVFLGAGVPVFGPVSPANKRWYWEGTPRIPHDPQQAKMLLASIGLTDRQADGVLRDRDGVPVRFTILTQKGRPPFERGVAVIRDELKKIGIAVDIGALEGNALIQQIYSGKYDAMYFNSFSSDNDPALTPDFWTSSGSAHFWNPEQKSPATEWEKQIDQLMHTLTESTDMANRKRAFDDVQRVFVEHQPAIYFVAPRIFVGSSTRVGNVTPALTRPQLLWSPDTLTVATP
ncbi:MAG TPA: ABC transporter substrate-binding protein [Vicinamibacterales bacterium]|nr:ABC transporter substrate-binding protein [Vicinamibacterales bacterium]